MILICKHCQIEFKAKRKRIYCSRNCSSKRIISAETRKKLRARNNYKKAHFALSEKRIKTKDKWKIDAQTFFNKNKENSLFILGISIYWAEGFKTGKCLGFTNSDPKMISLWVKWHNKIFPQLQIRGKISAHNDVNEIEAINFWKGFGLNEIKLYRARPISSKNKSKGKLPYGTLQVITKKGSYEAFYKMKIWIDMLYNYYS